MCTPCVATHAGYGSESTAGKSLEDKALYGVIDEKDCATVSKSIASAFSQGVNVTNDVRKSCSGLLALDYLQTVKKDDIAKGEFRGRDIKAMLSGRKNNQMLTCANRND